MKHKALLASAVVLMLLYSTGASLKMVPLLDGDAPAYFLPAVEFSLERGLTNPAWLAPLNDTIDGAGGRRYVYHGFLYPLVIGWLGKISGGGGAPCLAWMHFFNVLAAVTAAVGVLGFSQWRGLWGRLPNFLLPLMLFTVCGALAGRPEPMVVFIFGLGLLAVKWVNPLWVCCASGFLGALLFLASPAIGVLGIPVFWAYRLCQGTAIRVGEILAWLAGGLVALVLSFGVYPFSAMDWLQGVWRHSQINLHLPKGQGFVLAWITMSQLPLALVSFGVPFGWAAYFLWKRVGEMPEASRWGALLLLGLVAGGILRISFVKSEAVYNAVVWLPLLLAVVLSQPARPLVVGTILAGMILSLLGLARNTALLARQYQADAPPFAEVQAWIGEREAEGVQVSPGLFLAVPDPRKVNFGESDPRSTPPSKWRIEQQKNSGLKTPRALDGYELVRNRFRNGTRIFGITVSRSAGGWEYALYRKTASEIPEQ